MKYIILLLTFSCAIAVFSQHENAIEKKMREVKELNDRGLVVAYYHSDSLNKNYSFLVEQDSILTREQRRFETERQHKQQVIQEKYAAFEQEKKAMILSGAEMQKKQMELEHLAKKLEEFQQTELTRLQNKALELQTLLQNKVTDYAAKFCDKYALDVLLMQSPGGQFTYIQPTLDVTQIFIDFVNNEETKNTK